MKRPISICVLMSCWLLAPMLLAQAPQSASVPAGKATMGTRPEPQSLRARRETIAQRMRLAVRAQIEAELGAFAERSELPACDDMAVPTAAYLDAARTARNDLCEALETTGLSVLATDRELAERLCAEQQHLVGVADPDLGRWFRVCGNAGGVVHGAGGVDPVSFVRDAAALEDAIRTDRILRKNGKGRMNAGPELEQAIVGFLELMSRSRAGLIDGLGLQRQLGEVIATLERAPAFRKATKENSPLAHRMMAQLVALHGDRP